MMRKAPYRAPLLIARTRSGDVSVPSVPSHRPARHVWQPCRKLTDDSSVSMLLRVLAPSLASDRSSAVSLSRSFTISDEGGSP